MLLKQTNFIWQMIEVDAIIILSDTIRNKIFINKKQGEIGIDLKHFILRGYRNPCFERLTGMRSI